jgi:hypothetical protein
LPTTRGAFADHPEQESYPAFVDLVDTQGAAQQGVFPAADHEELPRPGYGGYSRGFQPDDMGIRHDLGIGDDGGRGCGYGFGGFIGHLR